MCEGLNPGSKVYQQNLENSIISMGNNYRLKKVVEKLKAGKTVYVAAIGGSVTEGAGPLDADGKELWHLGYAYQFSKKLVEKYPKAKIEFFGAGLSGTSSALGVIRYEKDIINQRGQTPDIFVIEFSVNDGGECTNTRGFERLIRNVLESNSKSAVIPVYAHATYQNTQAEMIPVAEFYNLPQISIRNALENKEAKVDLAQKGPFFADYVHPTKEGHNFMADCLMYLLEKADNATLNNEIPVPTTYKNERAFKNFYAVYSNTKDSNVKIDAGDFCEKDENSQSIKIGGTEFEENWNHKSGKNVFKIELNCKSFILVYKHQGNWLEQKFGKADVYVDGKKIKTLDGTNLDKDGKNTGWNDCVTEMLIDEEKSANHTIEVRMADGDENKGFTILAFGYSK